MNDLIIHLHIPKTGGTTLRDIIQRQYLSKNILTIPTLEKSVTLKIPAGTPSGKTFKIKGEGIAPQGRRPGDLYVKVFISPPTNLSRSAKKHLENYRDQFESGNSPRDYLYE